MTNSPDDDVDDNMFEYVSSSAKSRTGDTPTDGGRRTKKTVYELEREARINTILKEGGLVLPPPSGEATVPTVAISQGISSSSVCTPVAASCLSPASPPNISGGMGPVLGISGDSEATRKAATQRSSAEEAQRLKDQRYAIFRRNKALNQNALREVDPDTKRYVQIAYTPADGGPRQLRGMGRGSGRGTGRGNYGNTSNGMSRGARRPMGRGGRGFKRTRD
ncbi:uncharacterized protein TEOVI_000488500 [Trypanosoma equiperdum]|uniref:Uncharacterized protein n=2 Tax=Trypanozoon TaxID=39700 RepID=Q385M2_TRYB2|nr:hypothetical protein, conserved [Trypanosoma brucei brucei TREU927]EAN79509.1 hypothetical protein, conserved [Trypanosoma brucei brucei TREU927]SCU66365.1 hypothetical protein, conserved [Trypanosoma equiperdum]